MAVLEIVTRHHTGRPAALQRNMESVAEQTSDDWQQTLLIDDTGRGVEWANDQLAAYVPEPETEYIWVLDDDDLCVYDGLVAHLSDLASDPGLVPADLVMVRADCHKFGILPDPWMGTPVFSRVCMSNFIVRRDVWLAHAHRFAGGLGADFRFVSALWAAQVSVKGLPVVAAEIPAASWGAAECNTG